MTIWRKASATDTGAHVVNGWVQLKSIWKKTTPGDDYQSSLSANPWVTGGWMRIKSIWKKALTGETGPGVVNGWIRVWQDSSDFPVPTTDPTLTSDNLDDSIYSAGSTITLTRGTWSKSPTSYSLKIQSSLDNIDWSDVATGTGTTLTYDITYDDATSPSYYFRGRVAATNADGSGIFATEPTISTIELGVFATASSPTQNGATISWSVTPSNATYRTSQSVSILNSSSQLVYTHTATSSANSAIISDPAIVTDTLHYAVVRVISSDTSESINLSNTVSFSSGTPLQLVSGSYPTISGTVKEGQTISAVTGNWQGAAPITFEYQWLEPVLVIDEFYYFDIPGATSSSYYIPYNYTEDIAPNIALRVTAKNPGNTTGVQALSNIYSVENFGRPVGTAGTVTFSRDSQSSYNYSVTSVGNWTNTPTSYRYQWYSRDGIAYPKITGATSSTFDAVNYVTSDIFPMVWASNDAGESNTGYPSGPYESAETLGAIRSASNLRVYYKPPIINSFSVIPGTNGGIEYSFDVTRFDTSMSLLISYSGQASGSFSPYNSGGSQVQVSGDYPLSAGSYTFVLKATNTGTNGGDYFVTSTVANVTVVAPTPQYTIIFNANGGSVAEPSITVYQGQSVTAQTPTRSGFVFDFWKRTLNQFAYDSYNAGDVFTPTSSFTLVAQWIQLIAPSGGSVTITGTQKVNNTLTANVTNASGYPTPTYTYKWRRGVLVGGVLYFSDISGATSSTYGLVSADIGYYIRVEVTFTNGVGSDQMAPATTGAIANLAQYTITFNPNGGNAVAEPIVTVTEGESVSAPLPTRSGYTFSRWRNPPSGDLMYTYYAGDTFTPTESFTLTAIWTLNVTPVVPVVPNVTPVVPVVPNVTPVVPVVPVTPNVTTWYGSACCTSQFSDFGIQATRSSQAEVFNALDATCLGYMYNVQYSSVTYPANPCSVTPVVPVVPNVTPVVPVVPNVTPVVPVVPETPVVPVLPSCLGCFYGPIENGFQSICCYDAPACTYSCFFA